MRRTPRLVALNTRVTVQDLLRIAEIADRESRTLSAVTRMLIERVLSEQYADVPPKHATEQARVQS